MAKTSSSEIRPLNQAPLANLSIEELESRLRMEELDPRGEMWTGCGCAGEGCQPVCAPQVNPTCPPVVCGWLGHWG